VDISFFMDQQQGNDGGEQTTMLHTRDVRHARFGETPTNQNDDSEASVWSRRGDVLTLLLSGAVTSRSRSNSEARTEYDDGRPHTAAANEPSCQETNSLVDFIEQANRAREQAAQAKQSGNLQASLDAHSAAAKCYRDAAHLVHSSNGTIDPFVLRFRDIFFVNLPSQPVSFVCSSLQSFHGQLFVTLEPNASQVSAGTQTGH